MAEQQWWRDAVVYEVYVRSFADSDGDGVGDLEGLRTRLPHLVRLGVDALWVTPFYPSPMADHGYDVAEYCDVDPLFGDLAGFDRLLADTHEAGLRLIVDLVPNHTSSAHPWFVEALADPASPMRDRYVFRAGRAGGPPNNWRSVFFWLDRGVDGFRIDVAHGLFKHPELADQMQTSDAGGMTDVASSHVWDRDEVLAVYEDWRRLTDSYDGDRMLVGEVFLFDVPRIARYVGDRRLHQAFNFTVMAAEWGAVPLREVLELALQHFSPGTWVLSNHDLTRHVSRFGGGALGRRRGLAVTGLLLALPGSAYLYQGEELGLSESEVPAEARQDPIFRRTQGAVVGRDGCRTPVPWTADPPGHGFTTGTPWLPFGVDATELAVAAQEGAPASTLSVYRRLLARRRSLLPGLGGDVTWLQAPDDVLVLRRDALVVALNTAAEPVEVPVAGAVELLECTADGAVLSGEVVTVPAAATVWLRLDGSEV